MAPNYKIAVIQLYPKPMQIESNFAKASDYIRRAASQGAQLAVLPEYHLTNWVPQDPQFAELAGQWEIYLQKYQDLARECNICIVPGTIVQRMQAGVAAKASLDTSPEVEKSEQQEEEVGRSGEQLINVAYFINNEGKILGSYTKKNLWHPERPHLTSSGHTPHEVIQTPLGPVGLLICWDLAFPEAFRELIAKDAKIIIVPTFWTLNDCTPAGLARNPLSEALFLDSTITARTFENTCAVVFANAGGPAARGYAGLSQVAAPFVGAMGRMGNSEEGMSVVDLDMAILDEAEDNYKVRADLAREDWHYDYRHGRSKGKL
ncbi:MAG: hypothetical protein M4579_007026 [Chaenotheca gracillima]|nr:MAG: hypothetical protein M4579_007026 [Chaenotheca gracillima]